MMLSLFVQPRLATNVWMADAHGDKFHVLGMMVCVCLCVRVVTYTNSYRVYYATHVVLLRICNAVKKFSTNGNGLSTISNIPIACMEGIQYTLYSRGNGVCVCRAIQCLCMNVEIIHPEYENCIGLVELESWRRWRFIVEFLFSQLFSTHAYGAHAEAKPIW